MKTIPTIDNSGQTIASCIGSSASNSLTVEQAQEIMRQFIKPLDGFEKLAIRQALGRVLSHDVMSTIDVPAHNNSAMDGYAFNGENLQDHQELELDIAGIARAGVAFAGTVSHRQCIRIMTGAVIPAGCDTVVAQEFTTKLSESRIKICCPKLRRGNNLRLKGEDLALGSVAIEKGKILTPADLGLLASLGIAEVSVKRRLRVAFFSTGDELRSLGETLTEGCVYDSNRYTIYGMLTRLGCEVLDMGVVEDNPQALEAAMHSACTSADAIITSGGVSVGDADYTKEMMRRLGDVAFWSIAMRPGRPMAFGKIQSEGKTAYLFGLPGNPVAVMVAFYFLTQPALRKLMGASHNPLLQVKAKSNAPIQKRPGRTEYQRGIAKVRGNGELGVSVTGSQGSGILRSMSEANCIITLRHDQGDVATDDALHVTLFEGLI